MKTVWYIYDGNEYYDGEDYTKEELNELINTIKCSSWHEVREETEELLIDYYETSSDYGNPVKDLLKYIPDESIKDLLEEFNYYLKQEEIEDN